VSDAAAAAQRRQERRFGSRWRNVGRTLQDHPHFLVKRVIAGAAGRQEGPGEIDAAKDFRSA
jgi:hypothetical protein